ncbi:helix-turn-helix transcriptional regulator [Actinokineospora sp. NBRC 105648]|uniref:helix-turn-helix domain-containing protein n=1 Tax=Actinokineospora sp. NBRC 105648 TaxID=3032206 RepID=UPI0024A21FE7|nr:helix-turn-helix transcriptional regulator [Actinokineospora sp. NBRC 105648]GLZ37164.1 hypothetical protein Acsp05_07890 [Actinokineospora sp. NBRC 105648]
MSEDWSAVASVINDRVTALGWRQRELAERSHVSQAIVRELQHHTVERRRSARTLEALSTTLGLHPEHLSAVLEGRIPPRTDERVDTENRVLSRLDSLERRLTEVTEQLNTMQRDLSDVARHVRRKR